MKPNLLHLGLAIDSSLISRGADNFRPPTWPPHPDFPVVIDASGSVISRYGDSVWDLRPWAKGPVILNFGDDTQKAGACKISHANANLLRQLVAWWLYGTSAVSSPITLRQRLYLVRPLFELCSNYDIVASDVHKFPAVTDEYCARLPKAMAERILSLFHVLHEQREQIGFTLLGREALVRLEASLPIHEIRQTPYIPPRIWAYQVNRLRSFLDDFHRNREALEACYKFCLAAYVQNAGSLSEVFRVGRSKSAGPFWTHGRYTGERTGYTYHGPFVQTAERFGIVALLARWTMSSQDFNSLRDVSVQSLSTYLSMVGHVGMAYILNFSLMRIDEGCSLRADCLTKEHDEKFGDFYVLCGETTKTIRDNDARWPVPPSVKIAVDAMACVARLRMMCAEANPDVPTTDIDIRNPYLVGRVYEPWGCSTTEDLQQPLSVRPKFKTYRQLFTDAYPCLFNSSELIITNIDFERARLINPTLDSTKFGIGQIWPLAWHQLRRTGAVNMQASGLVSDASLQYLLKHASRAMSLYYGQGYSKARLNDEAQGTYIRTMYEVLGKEIACLFTDRFVSPYGEKRKAEILKLVSSKDSAALTELAKSGRVSWRETLLGGCTKRGPCPYGGIDNIARCGGGDGSSACADVLYDRDRIVELGRLARVIAARLKTAPVGSPMRYSLEAQQIALENALNVINSH